MYRVRNEGLLLWLALLALLLLAGCAHPLFQPPAGPPADTPNKRFVQAELYYGEALNTALRMRKAGQLSQSQRDRISGIFQQYRQVRALARTALALRQLPTARRYLTDMEAAMARDLISGLLSNPPE